MIRALEPWHLIVLAGIATLLFGAKRLPDNARSLGQSLRIFRSEMDAARTTPTEPSVQLPHPAAANQQDRSPHQPSPQDATQPATPAPASSFTN